MCYKVKAASISLLLYVSFILDVPSFCRFSEENLSGCCCCCFVGVVVVGGCVVVCECQSASCLKAFRLSL